MPIRFFPTGAMRRRRVASPAALPTLALAVAFLVAGCGQEASRQRQVFADAGAPLWNDSRLESELEIDAWSATLSTARTSLDQPSPSQDARWRATGAALERTDLGLVLGIDGPSADAPPASLIVDVDIDAASVETLELEIEAAPPLGRVELRWLSKSPGGRTGGGQLELDMGLLMADRLRAPVAFHSEWQGRIRRLEWRFSRLPDGQRLLVRGLRALAAEADSQALARALSTSWRVDLGRDVRPAILALPGLERRLTIRVPESGLFRVALGATAPRGETTFSLRLRDPEHVRELWRETLRREDFESWRPVEADLSPWQGREVTLELLIEASPWKPGEGVPAWGGPELLQASASEGERPDLILVSADTLRADHLSLYGYARETSPTIDRWAREQAVIFKDAVAPAPWTLPSHAAMLSGLDPLSLEASGEGVTIGLPAPRRLELLAERLRAEGYATFAETGGGYLHPSYGLAQGFDVFRYPPSKVPAAGDLSRAARRAIDFAERQPGPVFIFLHSYETHEPYSAREELRRLGSELSTSERTWVTEWVPPRPEEGYAHRRRFIDAETGAAAGDSPAGHQPVVDVYDSRVAHLDMQLEPLFDWVDERQRRGRSTALLFTSDHGESLGEDGRGGHASLEQQLLHIPLVLALPGGKGAGLEVDSRVRLYDVMPTLLEIAGAGVPEGLDGRSLLGLLRSPSSATSRQAWAASPSTNGGIAYDEGDWRFRLQPAAWAAGGLARFERLGSATSPETPTTEPDAQLTRRHVLRRLEEAAVGLELFAVNGGDEQIIFELAGSAVQNHRLKSLDAAERALAWRGQVAGARLVLAAGEERRLLLQTPRRGDLELRDGERRLHLDLATESLPLTLERDGERDGGKDGDGWRRSRDGSPPRSGLRLRWLGESTPADGAASVDGELQKQLRALGYTG